MLTTTENGNKMRTIMGKIWMARDSDRSVICHDPWAVPLGLGGKPPGLEVYVPEVRNQVVGC